MCCDGIFEEIKDISKRYNSFKPSLDSDPQTIRSIMKNFKKIHFTIVLEKVW